MNGNGIRYRVGSTARTALAGALLWGACGMAAAGERLPAFPGAEGFGAYARGGRGGRVIEVTNLNSDGPGSFQAAVAAKGPRMVVFRVGGVIPLRRTVQVREPFLTIAGQTAPGDGICLRDFDMYIRTHNVIVRHIRVRTGDAPYAKYGNDNRCIVIGGRKPGEAHDVMVDHCSFSWSTDQNVNTSTDAGTCTYQWCINSEGLYDSIHPKSPHSRGTILGEQNTKLSFHHNLLAHNNARNPLVSQHRGGGTPGVFDIRNNVIYKRPAPYSQILGHPRVNYVGNFLKMGETWKPGMLAFAVHPYNPFEKYDRRRKPGGSRGPAHLFATNNIWPANPAGKRADREALEPIIDGKPRPSHGFVWLDRPIAVAPVATQTPAQAYESVLAQAGCTRPVRDVVDDRIMHEVRTGAGHVIDTPEDVGGYPTYAPGTPPADTDHDGMPDAWEKRHGLNPGDPKDGPADLDGDGYTNVEEFLNLTDPKQPDVGSALPAQPIVVQAGNDPIRREAARNFGKERLERLKVVSATKESRKALLQKLRESGKEVADLLGIRFVRIPAGKVKVAAATAVISKPFELAATEVTQTQWEVVMGTRPWAGQVAAKDDPQCPASYVNYLDAQEFIARVNACGKRRYRLPTLAEWTLAARGGTAFKYGFDTSDWHTVHAYAWCFARIPGKGKRIPKFPLAVGKLAANPYGLFDMCGNVGEWCHDWRGRWYRRAKAINDPMGPESGELRYVAGGHFVDRQMVMLWNLLKSRKPTNRNWGTGFRLHRSVP